MALAWTELCQDLTDEQFVAAVKAHLKVSRFFPSPADILKAHDDRPCDRTVFQALPEDDTPRSRARGAISSAMILRRFGCTETERQRIASFFESTSWEEKDGIARIVLGSDYPQAVMQ